MNRILVPKITFKEIVSDEKRIERMYSWVFEKARKNISLKRQLTSNMSQEYIDVQDGKVFNNRGGGQEIES